MNPRYADYASADKDESKVRRTLAAMSTPDRQASCTLAPRHQSPPAQSIPSFRNDLPIGKSFLKDGMLWAGGDWCRGAKVQDAWRSGVDIAANVLRTLDSSLSAEA